MSTWSVILTFLFLGRLNLSSNPLLSDHSLTRNWQLVKECARPRNQNCELLNVSREKLPTVQTGPAAHNHDVMEQGVIETSLETTWVKPQV